MTISDAQLEIRTRFAGGFYGQFVSGILWLASAGLARGIPEVATTRSWPRPVVTARRHVTPSW